MQSETVLSAIGGGLKGGLEGYAFMNDLQEKQRREKEDQAYRDEEQRRRNAAELRQQGKDDAATAATKAQLDAQDAILAGMPDDDSPLGRVKKAMLAKRTGLPITPDMLAPPAPDPHTTTEADLPEWLRPSYHASGHKGTFKPEDFTSPAQRQQTVWAEEERKHQAALAEYEGRKKIDAKYPNPNAADGFDLRREAADERRSEALGRRQDAAERWKQEELAKLEKELRVWDRAPDIDTPLTPNAGETPGDYETRQQQRAGFVAQHEAAKQRVQQSYLSQIGVGASSPATSPATSAVAPPSPVVRSPLPITPRASAAPAPGGAQPTYRWPDGTTRAYAPPNPAGAPISAGPTAPSIKEIHRDKSRLSGDRTDPAAGVGTPSTDLALKVVAKLNAYRVEKDSAKRQALAAELADLRRQVQALQGRNRMPQRP